MTDTMWALSCLVSTTSQYSEKALKEFHDKWKEDAIVMDKWFSIQSTSFADNAFEKLKSLEKHELFDITNPNKVRSLFNAFWVINTKHFHAEDGRWYKYIADKVIELSEINPHTASRLVTSMINWKKLEPKRSKMLKNELIRIKAVEDLNGWVLEIVDKSLIED